ncbi:hypothetical protein PN498_13270 [Oscillatoria sp. CS-180]|uniref:hypothetical protein n=1 Tax=Oscillatoria sp. CS-180 TaxID=3021720 RepID=UPI0023311C2B|nr:hypothetical protein [Oscillatoria sp. CS-180]MDB9526964.1 hypothetical protein [Oscillatoria sp. CS-180]
MWHHRLTLALFLPSFIFLPVESAVAQRTEPDLTVNILEGGECIKSSTYNGFNYLDYGLYVQDAGTVRSISRQVYDVIFTLAVPESYRYTVSCRIPEQYVTLDIEMGVSDSAASSNPLINAYIYQSGSVREEYLGLRSGESRSALIDLQDFDFGANPNHIALELICQDVALNGSCYLHFMQATLIRGEGTLSSTSGTPAQPRSSDGADRTEPSSDGDAVFEVIEEVFDWIF